MSIPLYKTVTSAPQEVTVVRPNNGFIASLIQAAVVWFGQAWILMLILGHFELGVGYWSAFLIVWLAGILNGSNNYLHWTQLGRRNNL